MRWSGRSTLALVPLHLRAREPAPVTRQVAEAVDEDHYELIVMTQGRREYDVLHISTFDPEIDGNHKIVRTSARDFNDKAAFFTRRTRDIRLV